MSSVGTLLSLLFAGMIVNNVILTKFLGMCPFFGVSKKTSNAFGMGAAVVIVLTLSAILGFAINKAVLIPLNIEYFQTIVFIIIIASVVQIVELLIAKFSETLHNALGVYLPLITTNCAVLGVTIQNITDGNNLLETIFFSIGSGLGFMLVLILFSAIREQLQLLNVPKAFKGLPIAMITACLMSIAFMGFQGLI